MQASSMPQFTTILAPLPAKMPARKQRTSLSCPGSALITALVFTVIIALALAGMGTLTVSHYNLAQVQAASSQSLDIAEAGINWELYKLTNQGIANADNGTAAYAASTQIAAGLPGMFTVACATLDGSKLTASTKTFTITCSASVPTATGPANRIVRIQAQPYSTFYTLYTMNATSYLQDGIIVNGISGTNGTQSMSASMKVKPVIKGIVFNGQNAAWSNNQNPSGYNVVHNSNPLTMQGTTELINAKYPEGANHLAMYNDNDMAIMEDPNNAGSKTAGISENSLIANGNQKVTLVGKPGGSNYYLTNINMTDHSTLIFDNTNGPINIYHLKQNGVGSLIRGGHALKSMVDAPNNAVKIFMSATGSLQVNPADAIPGLDNSTEVDMGIYDYDTTLFNGTKYGFGSVQIQAGVQFRGQIIANSISIKGNVDIEGQTGYFETPTEYFGFSGAWQELNSAGTVGGPNQ